MVIGWAHIWALQRNRFEKTALLHWSKLCRATQRFPGRVHRRQMNGSEDRLGRGAHEGRNVVASRRRPAGDNESDRRDDRDQAHDHSFPELAATLAAPVESLRGRTAPPLGSARSGLLCRLPEFTERRPKR